MTPLHRVVLKGYFHHGGDTETMIIDYQFFVFLCEEQKWTFKTAYIEQYDEKYNHDFSRVRWFPLRFCPAAER
jgi:hypothetical protein